MYQGPEAYMQGPQIYYERLLNWSARLKAPLHPRWADAHTLRRAPSEQALTPYERERLLVERLPQGSPFIRRITEIFVQFRYTPRPESFADDVRNELSANWRRLRPVLWRAWLRRKWNRL